ncbi:MAG: transketolase [Spirochaetes bacterium]|nr:transketolase [Spirochaetota bacterium]
MAITNDDLKLIATSIRTLSMDAVQKANSGHPGMPMGCADIAAVLWTKFLKHDPADPAWQNRDRFVLSAGHGSMLLYSMLHMSGYDLTLDDIRNFRQLHSKTPGHPENRVTAGVETTTGPLGQGFANGIGMAVARDLLAAEFNSDGNTLVDHYIYAIVSDGDLMEGISSEAASLAGHWGLGKLIYIYDSNDISIEGPTDLAYSEDAAKRFAAYGWHVQKIDGHDYGQIEKAIKKAQKNLDRPSLIIAKTRIAKGSPKLEGSEESHGAPLGVDEVAATKQNIGCAPGDSFCVPQRAYDIFGERKRKMKRAHNAWKKQFKTSVTGEKLARWKTFFTAPDIDALRKKLPAFDPAKAVATRSASGKILEALFRELPNLAGGSADLGPSNKSFVKGFSESGKGKTGRNIHFGIREHAMGSIQNGMAYYGGVIPYTATFLAFLDYMRPSVRLAALAKLHTIYVYTHDSLFVGEDGPTHQPVEHVASARAIPNLTVIRPADAEETKEAWLAAIGRTEGPTMLSLTRQDLPVIAREQGRGAENLHRGAYIVKEPSGKPDIVILASGSEVHISIAAAEALESQGIKARVLSFPSWELFDRQPQSYRMEVLSHGTPKAVVEAGIRMGWEKYAGPHALYITMDRFGESAPAKVLAEQYGFTKENIVKKVTEFMKNGA